MCECVGHTSGGGGGGGIKNDFFQKVHILFEMNIQATDQKV